MRVRPSHGITPFDHREVQIPYFEVQIAAFSSVASDVAMSPSIPEGTMTTPSTSPTATTGRNLMMQGGKPFVIRSPTCRACRTIAARAVVLPAGPVLPIGTARADPGGPALHCSSGGGHLAVRIVRRVPGCDARLPGLPEQEPPRSPRGRVIGEVAQLHEGSHQACDTAIEGWALSVMPSPAKRR